MALGYLCFSAQVWDEVSPWLTLKCDALLTLYFSIKETHYRLHFFFSLQKSYIPASSVSKCQPSIISLTHSPADAHRSFQSGAPHQHLPRAPLVAAVVVLVVSMMMMMVMMILEKEGAVMQEVGSLPLSLSPQQSRLLQICLQLCPSKWP